MNANERKAEHEMNDFQRREDRELFVQNLGELLRQTREKIDRAWLDDRDIVHVVYENGSQRLANVQWDSYMGIIRDVLKAVNI